MMGQAILITGSRLATEEMCTKARELVEWAKRHDHVILVGDAPGVDAAVRKACDEMEVMIFVYGAYGRIRGPEYPGEQGSTVDGNYLERDRVMAERCDRAFAIKNAASTTHGTDATYHYAKRLGKPARLRVF
jgi:hypothetical protein